MEKKQTLKELLEELDQKDLLLPGNYIDSEGKEHSSDENKFVVVEDFLTLASFMEGNPMAAGAVKATMDLIWKGDHSGALNYLEKNHQDIKDQVMSLVYLQPHLAAVEATKNKNNESEHNES